MDIIKTERDTGMFGILYQHIPSLSFTFCSQLSDRLFF